MGRIILMSRSRDSIINQVFTNRLGGSARQGRTGAARATGDTSWPEIGKKRVARGKALAGSRGVTRSF